ncbi:hypothetical protein TI04_06965 [Achromatium sp. WMS2]|nr:hypothetical protein TI04_06965 [Achromatium sp. WMS2]
MYLFLWRAILIVLVLFGIGKIITNQMVSYYESFVIKSDHAFIDKTLAWDPQNATALHAAAKQVMETDVPRAVELASRAYIGNVTNGQILLTLANLNLRAGNINKADAFALQASRLEPTNPVLLFNLAVYWDNRGQPLNSMFYLSRNMEVRPSLQYEKFPNLLELAENPALRNILLPQALNPPKWWDNFYRYLATTAASVDTVHFIIAMRRQSKVPLTNIEREATINRFIRDQDWSEAYITWVGGLGPKQLPHLQNVYNGGFELPVTNTGFDWNFVNRPGVTIAQENSYGISGNYALHLTFTGDEFVFNNVYQYLLLNPGTYMFSVAVRTDSLHGRGGLVWKLVCSNNPDTVLFTSKRLLGTNDWHSIAVQFKIADKSCASQILRLYSVGNTLYDNRLEGGAWFDGVQVLKTNK